MYDFLPVSWSRSGAPTQRCTICCRCLGFEVVAQHEDVRFLAGVLVCCRCLGLEVVPSTNMYNLLPVSWSRSDAPELKYDAFSVSLTRRGAPARRCIICCRCLGSGAPAPRCAVCCRCLGLEVVPQHSDIRFIADLLPVSWSRSGVPALRCTMCCRCLGLGARGGRGRGWWWKG